MIASWQESYDKSRECVKKQRHHFADKGPYSQGYGLFSSPIQLWALDHTESRVPKNWCFPIVVLKKTLESPLNCKEIKQVKLKGNQLWILIGRTDTETVTPPLLWALWWSERLSNLSNSIENWWVTAGIKHSLSDPKAFTCQHRHKLQSLKLPTISSSHVHTEFNDDCISFHILLTRLWWKRHMCFNERNLWLEVWPLPSVTKKGFSF